MPLSLLDTDILSQVLQQKNTAVVKNATAYIAEHAEFTLSAISYYEVLRELKASGAHGFAEKLKEFCSHCHLVPVSTAILERAAKLAATAKAHKRPYTDASMFIAASALEYGCTLVTGTPEVYGWIEGLEIEDWNQ